jgi:hypothetical protein
MSGVFDDVKNRPLIIKILRNKPSWRGLCESLEIEDPDSPQNSMAYILYTGVDELRRLGILEFEGNPREEPEHDSIYVSHFWMKLQAELGLSLSDLVKICRAGQGLPVTPFLGRPPKRKDHPDIFVIMPFKEQYDVVYRDHVKKVANKLRLSIKRADETLNSGDIMKGIWADIFYSNVVIADCSERNANVFYELGIAHTLGKQVVMIRKKGTAAPFDIVGLKWIEYEYTPPGMTRFEEQLEDFVNEAIGSNLISTAGQTENLTR